MTCAFCGKPYEGSRQSMYCSSHCCYKADYQRNKTHRREMQKQTYLNESEAKYQRRLERNRLWRKENPERNKAIKNAYRARHTPWPHGLQVAVQFTSAHWVTGTITGHSTGGRVEVTLAGGYRIVTSYKQLGKWQRERPQVIAA